MDLVLDKVKKSFKNTMAVDDVSIGLQSGLYGLLGSNGAGKTTLMRMICTIMNPTEGSISYDGVDIFKMNAQYRNILGYLPQEFGFYPDLKVRDYLKYISALKGLKHFAAKKRIDEVLELTGMLSDATKKMNDLSGGMKRRVGIAQSLLNDPKILILDEPTSGLDPMERIRFRNMIGQLANDRIVLLSTHIVSDIEATAKEVFLMQKGKIIDRGTITDLCNSIPCRVWICRVKTCEADKIIATTRHPIAAIKNDGDYTEIKMLAGEKPSIEARCVGASLEDVFLYHFGENGGERDA
uniref:ABC-type multidrug transport system, ATPase component n=1 Tax=Eubacterium cellulosolvens (strain ATCC 43171 / JCM 9499 / 6) TaxID=633697 RepID=I5AR93_EUBC6